ncbi:ankyrin repeat, PH and SEC7 domain containing protein secG-like [Lolium rigidum]|uniref:ankyrin repeat, PH and SEC7 domain containing protein secG-like n=1 Tax=Lolium rigidum TaxID=89674 RepID=UPI001F5D8C51|nr:ankyrin repeat, PH and SEC7 domain containing protein secG-like [Lolium rigidum]
MASSPSDIALKAAFDGNLNLLKKMASKVDLRGAKDGKGITALHLAALKGYLETCRFLVEESGIDVNSVSKTGATPMSYAAREGNVQVMRYLLDRGGDPAMPDERGSTPLHRAAVHGHCEAVRLLLSTGVPVDPVDHRGAPLHLAASNDHVEVVKVLLEHDADLNKVANHILSPLLVACCGKSLKCIKLLIEAGADVNASKAGADPNIPNQHGATPIEQAAAHHQRELVEVLFPRTKPIPSLPDWSVDGIIRTVNSIQAAFSVEETIAYCKSQGKEAFAKEDYLTALSLYDQVLDINPLDASMFANQSLCWLRMRHGRPALESARKCRMMQPRWSKAWYREGTALSFMKDYEDAADAFREALQLDPKSEEIREALRKAEKAAEDSRRV